MVQHNKRIKQLKNVIQELQEKAIEMDTKIMYNLLQN